MQALENRNIKSDEINFRPSPNFKHMKKYRKSKLEENESASVEQPAEHFEKKNLKKSPSVMIQPPLPPNPPPPDKSITLKKEIIDEEYDNREISTETENSVKEYKSEEGGEPKKKEMCLQYARGVCNRTSCIFAHEIILSQLHKVYTFCKDFQNRGCSHPKCKFVHADIFEKEHYYRTGYLPPHVFAHLQEDNKVQAPPQPPNEEGQSLPLVYNNPPPPVVQPGPGPPAPVVKYSSPATETRISLDTLSTALDSPLKRKWAELEEFGTSRDGEANEPIKKCKTCDINEFRLQCNKNKVEKLMRASEEIHTKAAQLAKKNQRLFTVLSVLKSSNAAKASGSNLLNNPSLNILRNENETPLMDQLSMLFAANNRTTEEKSHHSSSISSNGSISSALAKLFLNTSEQTMGNDTLSS